MNTIEKKTVNAGRYGTQQDVDTFTGNYKRERWIQNSERLGKADSLSIWFTLEELENYLATVKEMGGDGVRFHFGAFPENYAENPAFSGLQNIVMVGTRSKDGTYATSKELRMSSGGTYVTGIPCPPFCGPGAKGKAVIFDNGENLSVI